MKCTRLAAIFLAMAGIHASFAPVIGAGGEGSVTGNVVDGEGAVIGAVVELEGPTLPKSIGVMTDAKGLYKFPKVPAGTYSVKVTFADVPPVQLGGVKVAGGKETKVPPV